MTHQFKILFITLLSFSILVSCSESKTEENIEDVFIIKGSSKIESNQALLYKANNISYNDFILVDTLNIQEDGSFNKMYSLESNYYKLVLSDDVTIPLLIDLGQIIEINVNQKGESTVVGSKDTDQFMAYENFRKITLEETVYPLRKEISETDIQETELIEQLNKQLLQAEENYRDVLINSVIAMESSIAIYPTIIRWNINHINYYDSIAKVFTARFPNSNMSEEINLKVKRLKQAAVGSKVEDIISKDPNRNSLSLNEIKGTYTLIDFWASWCASCRNESKGLSALYNKYKPKGFEIYGIALETKENNWLKAIKKDNRVWSNVSDLNSYESDAAINFSVTSLPKNFLIDSEGTIIAKDLHDNNLEQILDSLLSE